MSARRAPRPSKGLTSRLIEDTKRISSTVVKNGRVGKGCSGPPKKRDEAAVATKAVAVTGLDPFKLTVSGESVHVDRAGSPVQERARVPLKLPFGAMVRG